VLNVKNSKILIIDDEAINIAILHEILQSLGFNNITSFTDPVKAVENHKNNDYDLILLDIMMPVLDGFGVLQRIQNHNKKLTPPVIVLTADTNTETRRRALREGAQDFILKPYDDIEFTCRTLNILKMHCFHKQILENNTQLEEAVTKRTHELLATQQDIIRLLGSVAEYRDTDTAEHTIRVGEYSLILGQALGIEREKLTLIHHAAPMHDLGKIGISDKVLLKQGKFTPEERKEMEAHAEIGAKILNIGSNPLLKVARDIAMSHHEQWDGNGYPKGLKGEEIPFCARVVMVADVFDALTMSRPYKDPWPDEEAINYINEHSGSMFDPKIVNAFNKVIKQILKIKNHSYS